MNSEARRLYVFFGPPGSGKGSLSALCVRKFYWLHLSSGDLCRKEIASGSELGRQIDFTIKSGKLIPDGLITQMVQKALEQHVHEAQSLILDGYPRTVAQAQELDRILSQKAFERFSLAVIKFCIRDDTVAARIAHRLVCPNDICLAVYSEDGLLAPKRPMMCDTCNAFLVRRSDDANLAVIRQRLDVYNDSMLPLVNYYEHHKHPMYEISCERSLDEVFEEFRHEVVGV